MPLIPIAILAAIFGYVYYSSRKPHHEGPPRLGPHGAPGGPPGGPQYGVPAMPGYLGYPGGHPGHHHHRHEGMPVVAPPTTPAWLEPGMPQEYAQAVWQAYYFEHDPRNLHAFGDRLHEMNLHHAGDALHRRAEAMDLRAAHEGHHHAH